MTDRPLTRGEIEAIWGFIGAVLLAIAFVVWLLAPIGDTDLGDDDLDG